MAHIHLRKPGAQLGSLRMKPLEADPASWSVPLGSPLGCSLVTKQGVLGLQCPVNFFNLLAIEEKMNENIFAE